jgi:DNA-binding LacI/PurR family transcriptional regulator
MRRKPAKKKDAPVSMRQIAKRAKVSLSTVSVVLNHTDDVPVADETRELVLGVARELGYAKHSLARAIKSPLRHIGIAVGDTQEAYETFTSVIFQGAAQHLLASGYYPIVLPVGKYESETKADTKAVPAKVVELFESRLIDGLILDKPSFLDPEVRQIVDAGVPTVVVNTGVGLRDAAGRMIPTVTIDDRLGGHLGARHLLGLGHKKIAMVMRPYAQGPRAHHSTPVMELRLGYQAALAEARLTVDPALVVEGDVLDQRITYAAMEKLMSLPKGVRPTAMIVGDSQMALMAINALRRLNVAIPRDVSLVGYGDFDIASRLSEPLLTTVEAPLRENGRLAAANLIALLEQRRPGSKKETTTFKSNPVLQPTLRPGETTAAR